MKTVSSGRVAYNVDDALDKLHIRLLSAGSCLEIYLLNAQDLSPEDIEDLEDVKDTVLDAHLLVTWIKDNK